MKMTANTILITGGGSGIGRALAESFHQLANTVIIAGRRKEVLDEVTAANPGMKSVVVDVQDGTQVEKFVQDLTTQFPNLNVLINNAGIMRAENLLTANSSAAAEAIVTTNLIAPIRLTNALLPHLQKQSDATIINVTSGLAFVPLAITPTYCATKAALHSYTQSLRYQLRNSAVQVIELPPPYVATELMGESQATDPRALPLQDFINEVMELFRTQPDATEICVQRVHLLRYAADQGYEKYDQFVTEFNNAMSDIH